MVALLGGLVRSAARYVVGADDLDPAEFESDEPTVFEQRARVDQVLSFFEYEHQRYVSYVDDPKQLEAMRIEYYNCINSIEFQSEQIAVLVENILDVRLKLRASGHGDRQETVVALVNAKLDVGDRKTKRMFKERERRELLETMTPLIAEIKMKRLLEEQLSTARPVEDVSSIMLSHSRKVALTTRRLGNGSAENDIPTEYAALPWKLVTAQLGHEDKEASVTSTTVMKN